MFGDLATFFGLSPKCCFTRRDDLQYIRNYAALETRNSSYEHVKLPTEVEDNMQFRVVVASLYLRVSTTPETNANLVCVCTYPTGRKFSWEFINFAISPMEICSLSLDFYISLSDSLYH